MNIMGVDCAIESDNFGISVTVVHGSFKSPCPHDVYFTMKGIKNLHYVLDYSILEGQIHFADKTNYE